MIPDNIDFPRTDARFLRVVGQEGSDSVSDGSATVSEEIAPPSREGSAKSVEITEFASSQELAERWATSKKTIQTWIAYAMRAYPWIPEESFRLGSGNRVRYTSLCQEILLEYRSQPLTAEDWIASVHSANSDKLKELQELERQKQPQGGTSPQRSSSSASSSALALLPQDAADPAQDLLVFIQAQLEQQDGADNDLQSMLLAVEAEIVSDSEADNALAQQQEELRLRQIREQALQDAIQDDKEYNAAYTQTRSFLKLRRLKKSRPTNPGIPT